MDLEPILELMKQAPLLGGLRAVTEHFVRGAERLLPGSAVGACVVEGSGPPIVVVLLPAGAQGSPGRDPSRLFPSLEDERIFGLVDGAEGSTFHLAAPNGSISEAQALLAEKLADALGAMLKQAREFQQRLLQQQHQTRSHAKMVQTEKLASLGQVVAGVVHELNNPLTSIIAYSDYLKKRATQRLARGEDVDDDLERLRRIGEAAERILKFSRDLVAYSRPSGDIPGPVGLAPVVDKALVFCEHEFARCGISVHQRIEPALPPVRGIAGQLTQVFVNLFTNAAHAMRESGGELEIEARRLDDEFVLVEVADNGTGISEEDLQQIFEPFFTTKVDGAGSGLGLSIVHDIIKQHGGDLTAASRPGQGTVFRLYLPVVALPGSLLPPTS